ncbi:MAG: 6-pyruvoyl tetrahydrobiopterin synthase [Planctomycetota bacterium]|nr:MAG: 6-pyruvoyl tetrahydrobiopterin synthase [Planctomycetota bacterium]REJ86514.1 MAG: 6-pyruvoyl tetrahydrobiopterin synthase [Planctomycetota bacterium]REK20388.1 MAG: 6-pyruvoyl tetrahydrobiopterin synthase [Planctomycetota bacterium]REK26885.1 MAG: 6-pyruvoyl tetrahydrobiopterin synthase [Planctomycetota bacterium]
MNEERYRVRVDKDHLVFSAGHFITIETPDGEICERLHGHNWRTAVEVAGPLDANRYVFDFIALRDALQQIVDRLDHRMLLPTRHPRIKLESNDREVEVRYEERRWVFPVEECVLLPIEQTTAELLAQWIGAELLKLLGEAASGLTKLQVEVEENFGQWAIWETDPSHRA